MIAIATLIALASTAAPPISPCPCIDEYMQFRQRFHRPPAGSTAVFFQRCTAFCANAAAIAAHNADPGSTYTAELKPLHDLPEPERVAALRFGYGGPRDRAHDARTPPLTDLGTDAAEWYLADRVTDVRNQQSCGDCWAESATAVLESALAQQSRELRQLSVQQAAECTPQERNKGCEGGWPIDALRYAQANGGLCLEKDYPTVIGDGADRNCSAKLVANCTVPLPIAGVYAVPKGNETHLLYAAQRDVVSVAIDASGSGFYAFAGGVYNGVFNGAADCSKTALDHAVVVTGFGEYARTGEPYWLVRNSWGATTFGMSGNIFFLRGTNTCGIAQDAAYVLI